MTFWPTRSLSFSATMRAATSVGPPAGNGETRRMAFSGQMF
jgi:hypothetical protein